MDKEKQFKQFAEFFSKIYGNDITDIDYENWDIPKKARKLVSFLSSKERHELTNELIRIIECWEKDDYYPGPTELERLQHIFGEIDPEIKVIPKYKGDERHYVYSGVFKEPTKIQLELNGLETEEDVAKIDKDIRENTDALAVKVFHAVLAECYRQHADWGAYCYWDMNSFCDMLGYKRDKKGYHRNGNIKQVEKRLKMLASLKYRFELIGHDSKTKADKIVFEGPLMRIEPDQTATLFMGTNRIEKRSTLRIHDELHKAMMKRRMFAWFDKAFLKLNPQNHSRAILLYVYYVSQLAMGAKQRETKNIIKRPINTVCRETGIVINPKHKKREIDSFIEAHRELKNQRLIDDFAIAWGDNQIEIKFSMNHPTLKENQVRMSIESDSKLELLK